MSRISKRHKANRLWLSTYPCPSTWKPARRSRDAHSTAQPSAKKSDAASKAAPEHWARTCGELVDVALLQRHVNHLQLPQRPAPHHLHPPRAEHAPLWVRAQVRDDGGAEAADV